MMGDDENYAHPYSLNGELMRLRTELAAEREERQRWERLAEKAWERGDDAAMDGYKQFRQLTATVAKLREALVKARKYVFGFESQSDAGLLDRIDAVLEETKND
jgi:hypothetical protein